MPSSDCHASCGFADVKGKRAGIANSGGGTAGARGKPTRKIGITGGIGAGKSVVTDYLREKGYLVIDADEVAHEASRPGEPAMLRVAETFGGSVVTPQGELDRPTLAKLVFADPNKLLALNEIFHKDIGERIEKAVRTAEDNDVDDRMRVGHGRGRMVFLSVPLLFETETEETGLAVDEVWLVTADDDIRLRRAMARDGATEENIRARMRNQMPEAEKRERADVVLENNGTREDLFAKIAGLLCGAL